MAGLGGGQHRSRTLHPNLTLAHSPLHNPLLTFLATTQWLIHIMFQMSGYSVREVLKNSTPHPSSKGEGGLDPPESQPSPKSLNFLLILYFSRSFLEHVSCVLLHSCGVIAATEGLPPLQGIYTGIRGARINKKRKKFTPPFNFPKTGGGVPF